jgi:hypothetical protein
VPTGLDLGVTFRGGACGRCTGGRTGADGVVLGV